MRKTFKLLLIVVLLLSLTSCAVIPAYDYDKIVVILENRGYTVKHIAMSGEKGIVGYYYATKEDTGDELYYIYCDKIKYAESLYEYIDSQRTAKIAELKMNIERIEKILNSENVTPAEKGDYYEEYVIYKEELQEVQRYDCGKGFNVVWYGTKQAILDIRKGK